MAVPLDRRKHPMAPTDLKLMELIVAVHREFVVHESVAVKN